MKKLQQTRLHNPPEILGNCFPTVIACFLDLNSPEDVIQIQEKYKEDGWNNQLQKWLLEKGWEWKKISGHLFDNSYYLVIGKTNRGNASHICIYQNGELYHDPNPCNEGLLTEIKTSTPEGLEKERARHRDKYKRLGYKELQKEWDKDKPWKLTSVYKGLRSNYYKDLPREYELHHWNYNDAFLKDVFILNIKDHKELHNNLFLDLEKRIFYLEDGTYLDTKEKHKEYIESLNININ